MSGGGIPDIDAIEADVTDISYARLKLDDLLNEIVDKNEDRLFTDDENNKHSKVTNAAASVAKRQYSIVGKASRKKKKKDIPFEEVEEIQLPSYVIKLFDRQVDLAKFESDTCLYEMVREWMRNKPYELPKDPLEEVGKLPDISNLIEGDNQFESVDNKDWIYELPAPEKGDESSCPRPLPPALKTALVEDIIDTEDDIEELRKVNMLRWRKVRNRWKENSFRQQRRYYDSLLILRKIFAAQNTCGS